MRINPLLDSRSRGIAANLLRRGRHGAASHEAALIRAAAIARATANDLNRAAIRSRKSNRRSNYSTQSNVYSSIADSFEYVLLGLRQ